MAKKVVVGMSGGVDSAVAGYLLKKQGYEVIGLFMRNWDSMINNDIEGNPNIGDNICPQEQDYNDALAVCEKLDIPLHRVDFIKEYWDNVFTYFLEELKKGRTPNPDLMCNKYIKFDSFIKEARNKGYNVFCNPINIMGYSDQMLLDLFQKVNQIQPYAFSIVDTFGSMMKSDLQRIYSLAEHNLDASIVIGLHLHENLALSYSLAQEFIAMKSAERKSVIDASMLGMGRVPGNLCLELFMDYMNKNLGCA